MDKVEALHYKVSQSGHADRVCRADRSPSYVKGRCPKANENCAFRGVIMQEFSIFSEIMVIIAHNNVSQLLHVEGPTAHTAANTQLRGTYT